MESFYRTIKKSDNVKLLQVAHYETPEEAQKQFFKHNDILTDN